jgi:four helix bundle protein
MKNKSQSYQDIEKRTFDFAVRVIKMIPQLPQNTAGFELGKQVIRSAGAIHSNIVQARSGLSELDFLNHMKIACKESKETKK